MALIRSLLLAAERGERRLQTDEPDDVVRYHVTLLQDAQLAEIRYSTAGSTTTYQIRRLTWNGHELLDAMRNETIWRQVTGKVRRTVGEVTVDVLKGLLQEALASAVRTASGGLP